MTDRPLPRLALLLSTFVACAASPALACSHGAGPAAAEGRAAGGQSGHGGATNDASAGVGAGRTGGYEGQGGYGGYGGYGYGGYWSHGGAGGAGAARPAAGALEPRKSERRRRRCRRRCWRRWRRGWRRRVRGRERGWRRCHGFVVGGRLRPELERRRRVRPRAPRDQRDPIARRRRGQPTNSSSSSTRRARAVTLDAGWTLEVRGAASSSYRAHWKGTGLQIPAHGHFLIAGAGYAQAPAADASLSSGIPDAASLVLTHAGATVDALCYAYDAATQAAFDPSFTCAGTPASNLPHDDKSSAASNVDASLVRKPGGAGGNCTDTGDSAADFVTETPAQPESTASPPTP